MSSPERRSAILQAAARLFEHYGHGKTTMADVAREAHVGVGSVYLEFESKEAIVEALSSSTHVNVLEAMRAAARTNDHAGRLTAMMMARTHSFLLLRKKGQHACELVHCKTDGVRAAHERFRDEEHALLRQIVDEGQKAGTFAACDSSRTVALLQRAFLSLSPPWMIEVDDDVVRTVAAEMCELVMRGLLARNAKDRPASTSAGKRKPTKKG